MEVKEKITTSQDVANNQQNNESFEKENSKANQQQHSTTGKRSIFGNAGKKFYQKTTGVTSGVSAMKNYLTRKKGQIDNNDQRLILNDSMQDQ